MTLFPETIDDDVTDPFAAEAAQADALESQAEQPEAEQPEAEQLQADQAAASVITGIPQAAPEKLDEDLIEQLQSETVACQIRIRRAGTRRALTSEQQAAVAHQFEATEGSVRATKRLLNPKHESYKAVTGVLSMVRMYWKNSTVPFPDPGVRLIRRDSLVSFAARMNQLQESIDTCLDKLVEDYDGMKEAAKAELGDLYSELDYLSPDELRDAFGWEWSAFEMKPPEYLRDLNPELYEQQAKRIADRFDEALHLAEDAFAQELDELVKAMHTKLTGKDEDGKAKQFRQGNIDNLRSFFERFESMNFTGNAQLAKLVDDAKLLVDGQSAKVIRTSEDVRAELGEKMSAYAGQLDEFLEARGARQIASDTDEV